MKMTLNRNHVLVSPSGLSVRFLKGQTSEVPSKLVPQAIAIGAEIVESDPEIQRATFEELGAAQREAEARAPTIKAAVMKLLERNRRGDFTAGGRPNLNILARETGFEVAAEELAPIWDEVKAEMS